jgi:hypothetical protein
VTENLRDFCKMEAWMEHRKHQRIELKHYCVDAADGGGFFQGVVGDVSKFGLSLLGLSTRINLGAKKMTIVVSGQGNNFRMNIRPRWTKTDGASKSIGAEILDPPWGWTEFVMSLEPQVDQDVWASVTL